MIGIGEIKSTMERVTLTRQALATSELISFRGGITHNFYISLKSTPVMPSESWGEELDFKIAMRRRGGAAGASLEEMAKKYGL
jgi:hypothetical protein